jgi:hypothetical protein
MFKIINEMLQLHEIPTAQVLVTGARLKKEARVKLGCFLSGYSMLCPRVGVWIEDKMLVWVSHFDQIPVSAIKENVTVSANDLLHPPKGMEEPYREHVLNIVLKANLKQIRFDFGKTIECGIWFNNIAERPSSGVWAEPQEIWSCFESLT